jgi:phosphate transport system protein
MGPAFPDTFRVLTNSVVGIVRDTHQSLEKSDPQLANIVLQSQHAVWAFKGALVKETELKVAKGQLSIEFAFMLLEVAQQCEVIADHCTNIAEQVIYLTTGKIVRHMDTCWVEVPRQG